MSTNTPTLTRFLLQTETQLRFYDLGRRVSKITLSDFQQFERGEVPYPYPYEQTAWFGLIFWDKKDSSQHNIWFLRMPLDETGCIQLSARDEFMHLLLSRLKDQMNAPKNTQGLKHVLKDNPYVFKPTDDKLAIFHSKSLLTLKEKPTQYFTDAMDYLNSGDFQQWENLGVQGISDIAVRHDQKDIHRALTNALPKLPPQVFNAFGQALENETIDIHLAETIITRIKGSDDEQIIVNGVRALANCQSENIKRLAILAALNDVKTDQPLVLVSIAAKAWETLADEETLNLFIEKLALCDSGPALFNSLMGDLMFMPKMRDKVMTEFRNPDRSEAVTTAVGHFFQSITAKT